LSFYIFCNNISLKHCGYNSGGIILTQDKHEDVNEEIEKELLEYLERKDEIEAEKPTKKKYKSWVFICSLIIAILYISRIIMQIF